MDGISQGAVSSYTFTNVTDNHTISVTWTVTSCANQPVRIGATSYTSLQTAYNAATDGATIQSQAVTLTENVTANRAITAILDGGYDCTYTAKVGTTGIKGMLTTSAGTVTAKDIRLQN